MFIFNGLQYGKMIALGGIALLSAASALSPALADTVVFDNFEKAGGYTLADYDAKWTNPYGLGEMALTDTRDFSSGAFAISAAPFQTAYDFSVYDHLKYLGVSNQSFAVPTAGSITFSSTISAVTTGTQEGRVINGSYIQSGDPYSAPTHVAQQAAAVMNMIDFTTGQLFDIFVADGQVMTLIERLPSSVTNPALPTNDPSYVGIDKMYTQIIDVKDVGAGPHDVSITYNTDNSVSYFVDGVLMSHVADVGIPLDKQGQPYSGIYPSYGAGESLAGQIHSFSIGAGLFSLLDAFPFQHPDRPDLAVSIPLSERMFGQGISATFDNFAVTTNAVPEPATWAMMIGGFALAGGMMRRRSVGIRFA